MFHIKDDFRPGSPVSAVPAEWFNQVGRFLNHFVGDGIQIRKPDKPGLNDPVTISPSPVQAGKPSTDKGFPWGWQWTFGIEMADNDDWLYIHNIALYLPTRYLQLNDGAVPLPSSGTTLVYLQLNLSTFESSVLTTTETPVGLVATNSDEVLNIPLFTFNGWTLAVDHIHGHVAPLIWAPSISESNG